MQKVTKNITLVLSIVAAGIWVGLLWRTFPYFTCAANQLRIPVWLSVFAALGWVLLHLREIRGDDETRCRKCRHILRGISEPRCPECGERI